MKNFILTLVIAIVSSVNVFGQITFSEITFSDGINNKVFIITENFDNYNQYNRVFNCDSIIPDMTVWTVTNIDGDGSIDLDNVVIVVNTLTYTVGLYTKKIIFKDPSLSVGSQPEVSNLLIYPNPVQDVLNIRFDSYETVDVVVTDLNGRIVFNETSSVSASVDLSNQPSGVYLVKVGSETRKVVKQ